MNVDCVAVEVFRTAISELDGAGSSSRNRAGEPTPRPREPAASDCADDPRGRPRGWVACAACRRSVPLNLRDLVASGGGDVVHANSRFGASAGQGAGRSAFRRVGGPAGLAPRSGSRLPDRRGNLPSTTGRAGAAGLPSQTFLYRSSVYTVSGEIGNGRFWTASRDDQVLAMGHVQRTGKSSAFRAAVREAQAAVDRFLDAEEPAPYIGSNKPKTPCGGSAVPAPE